MSKNPETKGLRRLLAVKKSLIGFEQSVKLVKKVTLVSLANVLANQVMKQLLEDDDVMMSLYLTNPAKEPGDQVASWENLVCRREWRCSLAPTSLSWWRWRHR